MELRCSIVESLEEYAETRDSRDDFILFAFVNLYEVPK
jgi:hypothetical protein